MAKNKGSRQRGLNDWQLRQGMQVAGLPSHQPTDSQRLAALERDDRDLSVLLALAVGTFARNAD